MNYQSKIRNLPIGAWKSAAKAGSTCSLFLALGLAVSLPALAGPVTYESFDYETGAAIDGADGGGGIGWSGRWTGNHPERATATAPGLGFGNGGHLLLTDGNALRLDLDDMDGTVTRRRAPSQDFDGRDVWASVLLRAVGDGGMVQFRLVEADDANTSHWVRLDATGAVGLLSHSGFDAALQPFASVDPGEPHLLVLQVERREAGDRLRAWLNPPLSTALTHEPPADATLELDEPFGLLEEIRVIANGDGFREADEIRLGYSFAAVAPPLRTEAPILGEPGDNLADTASGSGWTNETVGFFTADSALGPTAIRVSKGNLAYRADGERALLISGHAAFFDNTGKTEDTNNNTMARFFPVNTYPETDFWFGAVGRLESDALLRFTLVNGADGGTPVHLDLAGSPGTARVIADTTNSFYTGLEIGEHYFVVARYERRPDADDRVTFWLNPRLGDGAEPEDALAVGTATLAGSFEFSELRVLSNMNGAEGVQARFDALRTGATLADAAPADPRPAYDKADHVGTVWTHVNDWKFLTFIQHPWETDYALHPSDGSVEEDAALTAQLLEDAGIDGIYLQQGPRQLLDRVLDGFDKAGNDRKAALFMGSGRFLSERAAVEAESSQAGKAEKIAGIIANFLNERAGMLRDHPNYHRVDGQPVIVLWDFGGLPMTPELWERALPMVEAQAYRVLWFKHDTFWNEATQRDWIPIMDGVTQYNGGFHWQFLDSVAETMHRDWPHKVFEANATPKHQSGYQGNTGVDWGHGTEKLRKSFAFALSLDPDSLHLTNWNDIEENSHIMPSVLQRDAHLRILKTLIPSFTGGEPPQRDKPELIVTQPTNLLTGMALHLEVLSLPVTAQGSKPPLTVQARWLNEKGEVVKTLEERELETDETDATFWRIWSIDFVDDKVLYPEISYTWKGQSYGPFRLRPTRLWFGNAPTDLVWMTPLATWDEGLAPDWELRETGGAFGPVTPGDTVVFDPTGGEILEVSRTVPSAGAALETEIWTLQNGHEVGGQSKADRKASTFEWPHEDHAPFGWVALRAEGVGSFTHPFEGGERSVRFPETFWSSGSVFLTRGGHWQDTIVQRIAVTDPDHPFFELARETSNHNRNLAVPIAGIVEREIPKYRVPYWHYSFQTDDGERARDISGYGHHGWLGTRSNNRQAIAGPYEMRFGHPFETLQPVEPPGGDLNDQAPEFLEDDDGKGFLRFDGQDDYLLFPPYTRFPQTATYEMWVRHHPNGQPQTLLSTLPQSIWGSGGKRWKQFVLRIDADGHAVAHAEYPGPEERTARAPAPLPEGEWVHIALTNDLAHWRLYIDGEAVAEALAEHRNEYRGFSGMTFGIEPIAKHHPGDFFRAGEFRHPFNGDVAKIRMSGRVVPPAEFVQGGASWKTSCGGSDYNGETDLLHFAFAGTPGEQDNGETDLLHFAFAGTPGEQDRSIFPWLEKSVDGTPVFYYRRGHEAVNEGVEFHLEYSTDLVEWSDASAVVTEEVETVEATYDRIRAEFKPDALSDEKRLFLRLRVER